MYVLIRMCVGWCVGVRGETITSLISHPDSLEDGTGLQGGYNPNVLDVKEIQEGPLPFFTLNYYLYHHQVLIDVGFMLGMVEALVILYGGLMCQC